LHKNTGIFENPQNGEYKNPRFSSTLSPDSL